MEVCLKRKMEPDYMPVTPATTIGNTLRNNEDSGYHTSFTPGSVGYSDVSNENLDPKFDPFSYYSAPKRRRPDYNEISNSPHRKGRRRQAEDHSICCVPTPTSYITGSLQQLHINRPNELHCSFGDCSYMYPTTPVKKICSSSVVSFSPSYSYPKSSPKKPSPAVGLPKKSIKKLNFDIQTITVHDEKDTKKKHLKSKIADVYKNRQTDIISRLYLKSDTDCSCISPVTKVLFSFLDSKDIYNFGLVSPIWNELCKLDKRANDKRMHYIKFIENNKENSDCRDGKKGAVDNNNKKEVKSLKDSNVLNAQNKLVRSPPRSPRTIKFKKFTKSASLDSRLQVACVRCSQPAKVTKEDSGEEWAECGSSSCSFKFCKKCNCERHPHKTCFQYDLEAPSPSKRKRCGVSICTFKSKRNLRRL